MEESQKIKSWYHWDYVLLGVSQFSKSTIQSDFSVLKIWFGFKCQTDFRICEDEQIVGF